MKKRSPWAGVVVGKVLLVLGADDHSRLLESALLMGSLLLVACGGGGQPLAPVPQTVPPASVAQRGSPPLLISNPEHPWMLPENVTPTSYALELDVDPNKDTFSGNVAIAVRVAKPSSAVVLHARGLTISEARVTSGGISLPATVRSRKGADERAADDELVLEVAEAVSGQARLHLSFAGEYRSDLRGLYKVRQGDQAYVFSQLEPMDARSVFPCFDEPRHKTPFSVRIRTPNAKVLAFSNTAESSKAQADGSVVYTFAPSPPMPTYLVAFAVGELDVRPAGASEPPLSTTLRLITPKGRSARGTLALEYAARHLVALEEYFGSSYPYAKLDMVAVPEFAAGAMENAGLVTFREERLLLDESSAAGDQSKMSITIAHELAHMWFGDLVTMKWWDELWLNEGFATWMASKIIEGVQPEFQSAEGFLGWLAWAMSEDSLPTSRAIRQEVRTQTDTFRAFGGVTYAKGAAVLGMVEEWIGRESFQRGIRRYIQDHAWKTATSQDLFTALGGSEYPVQKVMDSFTGKPGVPMLALQSRCAAGTLTLSVAQSVYSPLGSSASETSASWQIPVCVRFEDAGKRRKECYLLQSQAGTWSVPVSHCPGWVVPNAGQSGYYRSHLDRSSLDALVAGPATKLEPKEQVGLLMDLAAGLDSGKLPMTDFLELVSRFLKQPGRRPAAWNQFLWFAHRVEAELVDEQDRPGFERWLRSLLGPPFWRLGLEGKNGEPTSSRLLRRAVLGALGSLARDPRVIQRALTRTRQWLKDPSSVSGDEAAALVPLAASTNQREVFDDLRGFVQRSKTAEHRTLALQALGHVTRPELASELLQEVSSGALPPADARHVLDTLLSERRLRDVTFPWFTEHFDALVKRMPLFTLRHFVHGAIARCTLSDREAIERFFEPRLKKLEGMDGVLAESRELAQRCAAFRQHHARGLHAFLARL